MCFASTLSYPQKEFLNPCPTRRKFNPHPPRTRTQSSAGSITHPANAGTRNPRGLTRPAQDSSVFTLAVASCLSSEDESLDRLSKRQQ